MKRYGVYMMCSFPRTGAIYTGMSATIPVRALENAGLRQGGAAWALKYKARHLVYYEILDEYELARLREDKIKKWDRAIKCDLIERFNPAWSDLRTELIRKLGGDIQDRDGS